MIHWLSLIVTALTFYHAAVVITIFIGTLRVKPPRGKRTRPFAALEGRPFVSVLVPARNEEANIKSCLDSLAKQDYPKDKYEIVVVNDRSTDNTYEIIKNFKRGSAPLSPLKEQAQNSSEGNDEPPLSVVLVNIETLPAGMVGKQNAVKRGLAVCKGDIILNTDADCIAPPSWISRMVDSFDELTGFVAGIVVNFEKGKKATLFAKLQSLDLIYLMNFAIGCIGWGKPASCIGNNIAYRKQALEDIGGYDSLGYTMTEDAALIQAVSENTKWNIKIALKGDTVIITKPVETLKDFYRQRARWILGGRDTKVKSMIFLQLALWFNLSLLVLFPFSILFSSRLLVVLSCSVLTKLLLDSLLCFSLSRKVGRLELLKWILPYEAFLIFYSVLIGFGTMFARKISWKGQIYKRKT